MHCNVYRWSAQREGQSEDDSDGHDGHPDGEQQGRPLEGGRGMDGRSAWTMTRRRPFAATEHRSR